MAKEEAVLKRVTLSLKTNGQLAIDVEGVKQQELEESFRDDEGEWKHNLFKAYYDFSLLMDDAVRIFEDNLGGQVNRRSSTKLYLWPSPSQLKASM